MAIEQDIRIIKERTKNTPTKTAKELKNLSRRQTNHEKANNKQFQIITTAIAQLPTQDVIIKTIQDTIKVTVNGKIDGIKGDVEAVTKKVDTVGEHLKEQDVAIEAVSKKIKPLDGAREWLNDLGKIILYMGAIALAFEAIIQIYHFFK
jgi:hypothetical protein